MCEVFTEAVHSVALWTRVTSHVCTCVKCVALHHTFGHVWSVYRCSPFRSTLNTSYITRLYMCEVCTDAGHSVALWTRVTSRDWTYVKCVPLHHTFGHVWSVHGSSPFRSTLNTSYITPLYMCEVCTVTSHVWTCVKYVPKQVRTCVKYVPKSILGFSASAGNSASRLLGFSASPGNSASRLLGFAREFGFSASRLRLGIRLLGSSASRLPPPFRGPPLPPPWEFIRSWW